MQEKAGLSGSSLVRFANFPSHAVGQLERIEEHQQQASNNPANILGIAPPPTYIPPPGQPGKKKKKGEKKKAEEEGGTNVSSEGISVRPPEQNRLEIDSDRISRVQPADSADGVASGKKKKKKKPTQATGDSVAVSELNDTVKKKKTGAKSSGGGQTNQAVATAGAASTTAASAVSMEESLAYKIEQKLPMLVAYFDVFITSGRVEEAYEDFKHLRANAEAKVFVTRMEIFDALLRGFARVQNFDRVQELWRDLLSRDLRPTIHSYISAMMALSDPNKMLYRSMLRLLFTEFQAAGFTVSEALAKGIFTFGDREQFLRSLEHLSERPAASECHPFVAYSCPLVAELSTTATTTLQSQIETVLSRQELGTVSRWPVLVCYSDYYSN